MLQESSFSASSQDGNYPRPQVVRREWKDLSGAWDFEHDDDDTGLREGWAVGKADFSRSITVPFPPESKLSGIHDPGFHPVVWYRRVLTADDIAASGRRNADDRVLLHFGAVDYRASVWIDGHLIGVHEGGQTPFSFDVTELVRSDDDHTLVVRAEDDPLDVSQPRGKQDWLEQPHVIWYHRTTGIWQPVWLETVARTHVHDLAWLSDVPGGTVQLDLELSARPTEAVQLRVELSFDGRTLSTQQVATTQPRTRMTASVAHQSNGQAYETLLWTPEQPRLIDAHIQILDDAGRVLDEVWSYLGLRSVGVAGGHFLLNDRPYYVRSVLEQGYWPESHLAAPSASALRDEVQLIRDLGFNAARIHEKVEDPRFLFWADRLGLLVWGEMGSTFEFSTTAVERVTREWTDVIARDRSHPCIVTWVPLNESWGVQHISHDPAQLHFAQALYHLTKALDPSRPVVSNDGWEHADSDLLTIHDYATTGDELRAVYGDAQTVRSLIDGVGPVGRRLVVLPHGRRDQPVMVTEFGGVTYAPDSDIDTWGYSTAASSEDFADRVRALFTALQESPVLAGFCYTQLTDTLQEANGLTDQYRRPKLPVDTIRGIVTGAGVTDPSPQRLRSPGPTPAE
ncbi:MAG: glycoside hydrolase family 2 [Microbacteriaceae bacterium]|nr:glycoside hydrolase family 2 [Microbacteriaceae bacterium]HEV7956108.1 glycoside hydrolase family 2 TIM barrel-domain containing protein [Marisediminicola sp.]